ncbi:hypothetical protein JCM11491_000460 [Sporobolomyces phaffii]
MHPSPRPLCLRTPAPGPTPTAVVRPCVRFSPVAAAAAAPTPAFSTRHLVPATYRLRHGASLTILATAGQAVLDLDRRVYLFDRDGERITLYHTLSADDDEGAQVPLRVKVTLYSDESTYSITHRAMPSSDGAPASSPSLSSSSSKVTVSPLRDELILSTTAVDHPPRPSPIAACAPTTTSQTYPLATFFDDDVQNDLRGAAARQRLRVLDPNDDPAVVPPRPSSVASPRSPPRPRRSSGRSSRVAQAAATATAGGGPEVRDAFERMLDWVEAGEPARIVETLRRGLAATTTPTIAAVRSTSSSSSPSSSSSSFPLQNETRESNGRRTVAEEEEKEKDQEEEEEDLPEPPSPPRRLAVLTSRGGVERAVMDEIESVVDDALEPSRRRRRRRQPRRDPQQQQQQHEEQEEEGPPLGRREETEDGASARRFSRGLGWITRRAGPASSSSHPPTLNSAAAAAAGNHGDNDGEDEYEYDVLFCDGDALTIRARTRPLDQGRRTATVRVVVERKGESYLIERDAALSRSLRQRLRLSVELLSLFVPPP